MGKDSGNAPPDSDLSRVSGPWLPLQGPAKGIIRDLAQFYNRTDPYQYGPGVVQPFNPAQLAGQQGALGLAGQGNQQFQDFFKNLGGYASGQRTQPGGAFYQNLAQGDYRNPAGAAYENIYNRAAGGDLTDQAFTTLKNFAGGDYVGKNPYLDAIYGQGAKALGENFQETVNPTIEGLLSRSGGGGGSVEQLLKGQAQRELGTSLEDLNTKIYGGAYSEDMSRMLGAAQSLPGLEGQRIQTLLGAAGARGGQYQQDLQNRLTGVQGQQANQQNQFLQALQAGGALGGAYQNQYLPFNIMQGIGGQQQQQGERQAAEEQDRFRFGQDARFQEIQRYLGGLQGVSALAPNASSAAANYSQQVQSQPSGFQQFLGNATGLLGAAAPIVGSFAGPFGFAGGAALAQAFQPSVYGGYR